MTKTLKVDLLNKPMNIALIKSRRKSISLEIDYSGKILVKAPLFIRDGDIIRFIQDREQWLKKRLNSVKEGKDKYSFSNNSKIPYNGYEILLKISSEHKKMSLNNNILYTPQYGTKTKEKLKTWYKKEVKTIITKMVIHYCKLLKTDFNRIFIKEQKTRWGSCSGKKNLNFNWKVILMRPELIRYLVIHEVCHLIHMNHSKEYWKLVESLDNKYKIHRKELQEKGHELQFFLK